MSLISAITNFDKWLFVKINSAWQNTFFDSVMPFLRQPLFWLPLYLFLILFLLINFKQKGSWVVLFTVLLVAISDTISSHFLKSFTGRVRPCGDADPDLHVRLLAAYCGGNGSFPSSHATNHFGIAVFLFFILRPYIGKWSYLLFFWAAIICYAQVYVGVHYPMDVTGGALLGSIIGWLMSKLFHKYIGTLNG
ncbi:phosphatase PAP2 family protein [Ferruginibacter albus]|uniref:phosphatase PAP2 family protein n=1 Tax=Ferruginibacter albus TaxID=2875540 RepID=UPI001CC74D3B|nr:phosphatase PAP2 family protein [Ferruginibacter albus]UAY51472.1 phosphatase PAP2 family protein [Ferruginibacter albus]